MSTYPKKLKKWLEEDCGLTPIQPKLKLLRIFGIDVCNKMIGTHLKAICHSVKILHTQLITMDGAENKEKSKESKLFR